MFGHVASFSRPILSKVTRRRGALHTIGTSIAERKRLCSAANSDRRLSLVNQSHRYHTTRLFSVSSGDNNNIDAPQNKADAELTSSTILDKPLLLDAKAPLRPLLSTEENHLAQYTLPHTTIGVDDYQNNLDVGQRIVSFGDVHGDINALRRFLDIAGILDPESTNEEPIWSGGNTICVQTGDVLDRGDDELTCFRLLATLSRQADKAGGALLLLYGNHEVLNAGGLFQYANPGGNVEFDQTIGKRIDYNYGSNRWRLQFAGNEPSRWASFEPGGLLAENMLGNMLVACVVGRTVFVHAGLMASHLSGNSVDENGEKVYGGVSRINKQAREWILKAHHGDNNNWGEYNEVEDVIAAAQNRAKVASKAMPDCLGGGIGPSSPVWMRDYSQPNDKEPKNRMAESMIVDALNEAGVDVQRMVMGHTPQRRINSALGGKAWRIDVGASDGVMGGTPEVLEIIHMAGEDDEDIVNVLTEDGKRIKGQDRSSSSYQDVMSFFDLRR